MVVRQAQGARIHVAARERIFVKVCEPPMALVAPRISKMSAAGCRR
jgi:hypothetical protein